MKGRSVSLTRYQRDLEARGLRPNTVRTYVRTVAEFLQALGGPPVDRRWTAESGAREGCAQPRRRSAAAASVVLDQRGDRSNRVLLRGDIATARRGGSSATGTGHASSADAAERPRSHEATRGHALGEVSSDLQPTVRRRAAPRRGAALAHRRRRQSAHGAPHPAHQESTARGADE